MNWETLGGLLAILAVFSGVVIAANSAIVKGMKAYFEERLKQIEQQIQDSSKHWQEIERDLLELKAELPKEYVRREDWLRFSAVIDAKLDALRTETAAIKEKIYERARDSR